MEEQKGEVQQEAPKAEEYPTKLHCPRCRRSYDPTSCFIKADVFFGEVILACKGCRRKLWKFSMKDWYEKYISVEKQKGA